MLFFAKKVQEIMLHRGLWDAGIGKTTYGFNLRGDFFQNELIKERLHRKNVLVVFDDVTKENKWRIDGRECWFGDGSIIIVVTKNKHLLTEVQVDGMYHAKELNRVQSLHFSVCMLQERPAKDYEELSGKVVDYCDGHPWEHKRQAGWEIDIAIGKIFR
uniref:Uncharacterized protein n=1 Tax=Salix viminalis TaxID=40686 RepID=A0A6N2MEY1_SALVM